MILFDLEGTLTRSLWRQHFAKINQWYDYHKRMIEDRPNYDVIANLDGLKDNFTIVILTGMEEEWRKLALEWMDLNDIYYDHLYMRPTGDKTTTVDFKRGVIEGIGPDKFSVAFDDQQRNVDMFIRLGIPAIKVVER